MYDDYSLKVQYTSTENENNCKEIWKKWQMDNNTCSYK